MAAILQFQDFFLLEHESLICGYFKLSLILPRGQTSYIFMKCLKVPPNYIPHELYVTNENYTSTTLPEN